MDLKKESRDLKLLEDLWNKSNELENCIKKLPGSVLQAALLFEKTQIIIKSDRVIIRIPYIFSSVVLSNIKELKAVFKKKIIVEIKEEER